MSPILHFSLHDDLVALFGKVGWARLQKEIGKPERQADVRRAFAAMELSAIRAAAPRPLPSTADLAGILTREAARKWSPDVRQQVFKGEDRRAPDAEEAGGGRARWRQDAREVWTGNEGKKVPSLAPADDAEVQRTAGLSWGAKVDVSALRDCIRPNGDGDVWAEDAACAAATEGAGASAIADLFRRWRDAETPWAVGGIVARRRLCRGLSTSQARVMEEGLGLQVSAEHDGTPGGSRRPDGCAVCVSSRR